MDNPSIETEPKVMISPLPPPPSEDPVQALGGGPARKKKVLSEPKKRALAKARTASVITRSKMKEKSKKFDEFKIQYDDMSQKFQEMKTRHDEVLGKYSSLEEELNLERKMSKRLADMIDPLLRDKNREQPQGPFTVRDMHSSYEPFSYF